MRFVFVGSPSAFKARVCAHLVTRYLGQFPIRICGGILPTEREYALGLLADYRLELAIASRRALAHLEDFDGVVEELHLLDEVIKPAFTNKRITLYQQSLFDSLTYAWEKMRIAAENQSEHYGIHAVTAALIAQMTHDSVKYDHVFFIETDDEFSSKLRATLDDLEIKYTALRGLYTEVEEEAAAIMQGYLDGDSVDS